jgi:hypothetical protein
MKTTLNSLAVFIASASLLSVGSLAAAQADTSSADGPRMTVKCTWTFDDPKNKDYDILVGASFTNMSDKTAVAVKFTFTSIDDFGKRLDSSTKTVYGSFAPGVLIEPRRRIGDHTMFTDATTAAIDFYNLYNTEVTTMECRADAIKYSDGSIWTNPRTRD